MQAVSEQIKARKAWMGVLAKAPAAQLSALWRPYDAAFDYAILRAPEVGGVMVRGRAGAVGAPFNLGEMTVTRCSVRMAGGAVGHGYVQGRDKAKAVQAAVIDALMQTDAAPQIEAAIVTPLRDAMAETRAKRAAKAAATKVDFFTMVRGED